MSEGEITVRGTAATAEQKAEMASLRTVFDPKAALDRVDTYGKWLFTSAAVVGSLGAGLSNAAFTKLHGPSTWLFATAVLSLGVCLIFASASLAPQWVDANYYQLDSMRGAVNKQFAKRQFRLTSASIFFALALFLAAIAPLVSLSPIKSEPSIHYSIDEKGGLDASLEASDLQAGTVVGLRLESADSKTQTPSTSAIADNTHQVKLNLKMSGIGPTTPALSLIGCIRGAKEQKCASELRLPVQK